MRYRREDLGRAIAIGAIGRWAAERAIGESEAIEAIVERAIERRCRRWEWEEETPREGKRRGGAGFLEILGKKRERAGYLG